MGDVTRNHLQQNYNKLGPLTNAQFLATKALAKRLIYARQVDLRSIVAIDHVGQEYTIGAIDVVDEYKRGNIKTLKLKATVRGMSGGTEQTGNVKMDSVIDVEFDSAIGVLVVETDNCVLTNMPCWEEMKDLATVMRDQTNWVDAYALNELLPPDVLLSDFVAVRDSVERTIDHGVDLGHLSSGLDVQQFDF